MKGNTIIAFNQSGEAMIVSKNVADNLGIRDGQVLDQNKYMFVLRENCLSAIDACKTALSKQEK